MRKFLLTIIPVLFISIATDASSETKNHSGDLVSFRLAKSCPPDEVYFRDGWQEPGEAQDLYKKGLASFDNRDYAQAIDYLSRSAQAKPDKQTFILLGRAHLEIKQYPQAIRAFQQSIKLNPESAAWGLWYVGQAYDSWHHSREAMYFYNEVLVRFGPRDPDWDADHQAAMPAIVGASIVKLSREAPVEAIIPSFQATVQAAPKSAWDHSLLGQMYAAYGMNREAFDALSEALRLGANDKSWNKNMQAYTESVLAKVNH